MKRRFHYHLTREEKFLAQERLASHGGPIPIPVLMRCPMNACGNGPAWPFATTQALVAPGESSAELRPGYVSKRITGFLELFGESAPHDGGREKKIPWIDEDQDPRPVSG